MIKMLKYRTFRFTLVELIVSMAVFLLLSMVVIQLFSATQKLWSRNDGKNEVYQDAQMTLDLICDMLNNISHATTVEQGSQFFRIENAGVKDIESDNDSFTHFSELYLATKSNLDSLPQNEYYKNPIRFVTFQVVEITDSGDPDNGRNCLVMRVLSDKDEAKFTKYFPPENSDNENLVSELKTDLKTKPQSQDINVVRLLNNVVAFRVRPGSDTSEFHQSSGSTYQSTGSATFPHDRLPVFVEVTLQLMDRKHYDEYKGRFNGKFGSADAREYRLKYSHTFRRYIHLGLYRGKAF